MICRSRKVRCDKQSPCANCRRGNVPCTLPPTDRPPRWARRLERVANTAASIAQTPQELDPASAQVMERLRNLEALVKELNGQLEEAHAANSAINSSAGQSPEYSGGAEQPSEGSVQSQFGRLVIQDSNRSRYISSGFWSRVNDEVR